MKTKFKFGYLLLVMFTFATFIFISTPLVSANASNIDNTVTLYESRKCADFVKENFNEVIANYNVSFEEEICQASYIEGECTVYIIDEEKFGIYLDFDEDNGYMLISQNFVLYEFEPSGDLPYLKEQEFVFYTAYDKFLYYNEITETYERFTNINTDEELYTLADTYVVNPIISSADGQPTDSGDGAIYDIDAYVASMYPNYKYVSRKIIPDYQWVYQWDTSVYQSDEGSEGNCVINATYSMMNDWHRKGIVNGLPTGTIDYRFDVLNDRLYSEFGANTNTAGLSMSYNLTASDSWRTNDESRPSRLPRLYMELREYAIDYGYKPEGGFAFKYVINMAQNVAKDHNISLSVKQSSSFNTPKDRLNNNRACAISVIGSSRYHNHAMGLYGYVEYNYTSGWWIFSSTKTAYFYIVDDGYWYKRRDIKYNYTADGVNYPVCYFDPNTSAHPSITFAYLN